MSEFLAAAPLAGFLFFCFFSVSLPSIFRCPGFFPSSTPPPPNPGQRTMVCSLRGPPKITSFPPRSLGRASGLSRRCQIPPFPYSYKAENVLRPLFLIRLWSFISAVAQGSPVEVFSLHLIFSKQHFALCSLSFWPPPPPPPQFPSSLLSCTLARHVSDGTAECIFEVFRFLTPSMSFFSGGAVLRPQLALFFLRAFSFFLSRFHIANPASPVSIICSPRGTTPCRSFVARFWAGPNMRKLSFSPPIVAADGDCIG